MGLSIQFCKCLAWAPFGLPLVEFFCSLNGILFGFASFTSSFLQEALGKDVRHVNMLPRLEDVQVAFGYLLSMFHPKVFLFASLLPPFHILKVNLLFLT
jgi:hypothetical protein